MRVCVCVHKLTLEQVNLWLCCVHGVDLCVHASVCVCVCTQTNTGTGQPGLYLENVVVGDGIVLWGGAFGLNTLGDQS